MENSFVCNQWSLTAKWKETGAYLLHFIQNSKGLLHTGLLATVPLIFVHFRATRMYRELSSPITTSLYKVIKS